MQFVKKETLFLGILPYECVTMIFKCLGYQQLKKVETKKKPSKGQSENEHYTVF